MNKSFLLKNIGIFFSILIIIISIYLQDFFFLTWICITLPTFLILHKGIITFKNFSKQKKILEHVFPQTGIVEDFLILKFTKTSQENRNAHFTFFQLSVV